ncbi:MAG TPA: NAD-dependent epimerase/dehydratase family protein [Anaerolineales bacterium]|nr:NAD-dependent epimerase/dehydratase family protein [Anaerolineales bacterium]
MGHYLVTGAAGFIGARVSEMLTDAGHTVLGIDNLSEAYDLRLKDWRLARLKDRSGFEFALADIRERQALKEAVGGRRLDGVINLAARAGVRPSVTNPWIYTETNVGGALNVLELCREFSVPKLVQASTSSVYGSDSLRPFREDADVTRPLSPYAATKAAAELLAHTYHSLHGLDVTVLRFFTVFGPAGRPDMSIFRFVQWIEEGRPLVLYGDGNQERDYTFIDDIARGTIAALRPMGYEIINLGGDEPVSIREVIGLLEELIGKPAQIDRQPDAPGDVRATWANIDKARSLLDWEPQVARLDGLADCVAWYRAERAWAAAVDTSD